MNSKWIFCVISGFLVLLVIIQNTQVIKLQILFWHLSASRILFLALVFILGLVLGFALGRRSRRRF